MISLYWNKFDILIKYNKIDDRWENIIQSSRYYLIQNKVGLFLGHSNKIEGQFCPQNSQNRLMGILVVSILKCNKWNKRDQNKNETYVSLMNKSSVRSG